MKQWWGRRLVASLGIVVLVAGCGKQASAPEPAGGSGSAGGAGSAGSAGGAGSATSAGNQTPPAPPPTGPKVGTADATLVLPAGTDAASITVTPRKAADVPALQPFHKTLDTYFKTLKVVELGPDGTRLASPGELTVTIDPADLPAGAALSNVIAVIISSDGTIEDVPVTPVGGNQVKVSVAHFSLMTFLLPAVVGGMVILGTGAILLRGVSDPMMRKDCASYLTPESPKIAELATEPDRFTINLQTGELKVDATLKGKDVDVRAHAFKPDQVLEKGVGDCVNMSNVMGSLMLARNYPVRLVAGTAQYTVGHKTYKGFHQWAETVINGKPYYVDTFEPTTMKLVPLADASLTLKLERNKMCGKNPDGTEVAPVKYDATWVDAFASATGKDEAELAALLEEHRRLNKLCQKEGGNNSDCIKRKETYDKAKALQDKLNALKQK